jgi:NAD+ diphosphatase
MRAISNAANYFAGGTLDRVAHRRRDDAWLREAMAASETRLLPFWQGKHLVHGPREAPRPAHIPATATWWRELLTADPVFLGLADGVAHFALDLSALPDPAQAAPLSALGAFVDLRSLSASLDPVSGNLLAVGRGLLLWHQRHRFCAVCGNPTRVENAGHSRRCVDKACDAVHFPRTDPVVIMLITDGDRCLLGRQPRFPPGFYSCLAGFVEPGEALEDAVARESFEEAGVQVTDITYQSSQPWPFPASLMMGFHARATTTELTVDGEELEEARWFERGWIRAHAGTESFMLPPRSAIARSLLDSWLYKP